MKEKGWLLAAVAIVLLAGLGLHILGLTDILPLPDAAVLLALPMALAYLIKGRHPTLAKVIVVAVGALVPAWVAAVATIVILASTILPGPGGLKACDMGATGAVLFVFGMGAGVITYVGSVLASFLYLALRRRR